MRVITKKAVLAFLKRRAMKSGNMQVYVNSVGETRMLLHRNCIASMDTQGVIEISNAGWNSRTTNDRLNGLLHYLPGQGRVCCKDFSAYFNGAPWSGAWTVVNSPEALQAAQDARDLAISKTMHRIIRYDARQAALDAALVAAGSDSVARNAALDANHIAVYNSTLAVLGAEREIKL